MDKIAVIGIDGLPPFLLEKIKEYMPGLKNILDESTTFRLRSTIPPWTPPAWISMITGVSPARHGIYTFHNVYRTDTEFRTKLVSSSSILYPTIYEVLDAVGVKGIYLNIPASYPPPRLEKSIIVSDWASPSIKVNHPEYEYLAGAFSKNIVAKEYSNLEKLRKAILDRVVCIVSAIIRAVEQFGPIFLFTVFSELDWIMHQDPGFVSGKNVDFYQDILREIDKLVLYLHDKHGMRIIVVSDHGFKIYDKMVFLGNILLRANIRMASISYGSQKSRDVKSKLISWVSRHKRIKLFAKKIALKTIGKISSTREIPYESVDVLNLGGYCLYLSPKVSPERVVNELLRFDDLIEVYTCEQAYQERCLGSYPDIIVVPKDNAFIGYYSKDNNIVKDTIVSQHHPIGVLAIEGLTRPNDEIRITNVFSLILSQLGLPIPSYSAKELLEKAGIKYEIDDRLYTRLLMSKKIKNLRIGRNI